MITAKKNVNGNEVEVKFEYVETCKVVYKTLKVFINKKRSNIRGLRKHLNNQNYPRIIEVSTFYWKPGRSSRARIRRETITMEEVKKYFIEEGFYTTNEYQVELFSDEI